VARRVPPAGFQQVGEGDEVRLDVGRRVLERVAHAGLRGEVQHGLGPRGLEQARAGGGVGEIGALEAKAALALEPAQALLLQRHRVVG
jgi:hypothetical protein